MDEDFGERLRSAVGTFVRSARDATDDAPPSHIETMGVLFREGPQSTADLARRRGVRHQSESATVAELMALGLIERDVDPADGRGWLLSLTETGRAAVVDSRQRRASWITAAAESLDADERALLGRIPELLTKLAAA